MFRFLGHDRSELLAKPLPESWLGYVLDNVFLYRLLSEEEQARLHVAVNVFVAEKNWEGCAGLHVTDEVRVTIAAQAGLLLLGFEGYYFDDVDSILVYPGGYLACDPLEADESPQHRLGEAHYDGPVVVSWWQALWDGRRAGRHNLVLHEFAHQLTRHGDRRNGVPPIDDPELERRWRKVFSQEYRRLGEADRYGRHTLLDPYGATNRAEFFAVATECFFLQPAALRAEHPRLYAVLSTWFCQDPAARRLPSAEDQAGVERATQEYEEHILAECSAAIRLRPNDAALYLNRAGRYADRGEYEKALADLNEAIRIDPEDAEAHCERGSVWFLTGDLQQAITDFSAAIDLCPNHAHAYRERGVARAEGGDLDGARADLTRAIRLDPKDDEAYYERGLVRHGRGQYGHAVRDFSKAIRVYPHWAEYYCSRARSLHELGEHDRAIADCDQAARLEPEYVEAYRIRALVHTVRGALDEARQDQAHADALESHLYLERPCSQGGAHGFVRKI
jgi:Mlc titration factor MtfA (ptsG expression regulator)/Flp pilus assembly protein TadD